MEARASGPKAARSTAGAVLLSLGTAFVVAGWFGSYPPTLPLATQDEFLETTTETKNTQTISIYKRTFTSVDPLADAQLLREGFGLETILAEKTLFEGESLCAERSASTTLDGFQIHFFRSFITAGCDDAGAAYPQRWAADQSDPLPSLTFYAPSVAPFAARLRGINASFAVARGADDLTSLVARLPGAGVDVEVVAEYDADAEITASFASRDKCPKAFALDDSLDVLRAAYATYGGGTDAATGLPSLLVVSTTWPSLDAAATPTFLGLAASAYGATLDVDATYADACTVTSTRFERIAAATPGGAFPGRRLSPKTHLVSVRSVERRGADDTILADLTAAAADAHARNMRAPESGWDAFLDSHVGLKFSDDMTLDAALDAFRASPTTYFHSHATGYAMEHGAGDAGVPGAVWVAYAGDPWAFEIPGAYANPPHAFSVLDYCSPTSVGDNTLNTIVDVSGATRAGGPPD